MWKTRAEQLRSEGKKWGEIARIIKKEFNLPESETVLYERIRGRLRAKKIDKEIDIVKLLKNGIHIDELIRKGISRSKALKEIDNLHSLGINIKEENGFFKIKTLAETESNVYDLDWTGNKIIRFGLMGDTQINSKYAQITHLHTLYDFYKSEGIKNVYHTGDIDEGEEMRQGHKYECYTQGADEHSNEICRVYPKRDGITTHFITGNHDHSLIKRAGYDIGITIAKNRPDMKYLGQSGAILNLTPNCTLELRHPIDGTAYAVSYKIQKMVEAMSGGEKPNILAVGHYHKNEYLFYRNIHSFQTGCLQAQTPWMRGKQISASMGGWLVEVHVNSDGEIERIKQEFKPFYKAIKDDYLNWR